MEVVLARRKLSIKRRFVAVDKIFLLTGNKFEGGLPAMYHWRCGDETLCSLVNIIGIEAGWRFWRRELVLMLLAAEIG